MNLSNLCNLNLSNLCNLNLCNLNLCNLNLCNLNLLFSTKTKTFDTVHVLSLNCNKTISF
jgi:hypothetical protein